MSPNLQGQWWQERLTVLVYITANKDMIPSANACAVELEWAGQGVVGLKGEVL